MNGNRDVSPLQALVFDVGNVVIAHDNAMLFDRLAARCGGRCSADQVRALAREPQWGIGAAPISELHRRLRDELGYGPAWDGFVEDWCCHFALDPSMLAFLERLSVHNRVLLFSNTNKEHWDFVAAATGGALDRFERYLSHEIGCAKPSVESFALVAAKAGIDPARSLFFDDLPENVQGARQAGFQAEIFASEAQLSAFLSARGVRLE